ncbi:hypothetical protein DASC09_032660 [Saccharomycopsis crataegensis]|uniref:Dienelactone hydrolase domain-containing protein n=1 Tax=Saccharomycopsis crataegensis TaxID=43959 RepID=A0AAV5QMY3_9ASCO|nr:hypothetical protein DASC09_032660 [Saccharomycopsis crataegensis]
MASLPPAACCLKRTFHEGERKGTLHKSLYGLASYEVGDIKSKRVLIVAIDIYGHDFLNTNLIADEYAAQGYYVVIPDILLGDPVDLSRGMESFQEWKVNHGPEVTIMAYHNYLIELKKTVASDAKLFSVAYCFGAHCVIKELGSTGLLTAGAIAHPSNVTTEAMENVTKPLSISAAQIDQVFTTELRHKTEEILIKNDVRFQITLFSGVSHGFAIKGDINDKVVKYAKEKCFYDVVSWFGQF